MRKLVLIPPGPRRRGAPLGNRNALKHGRYTRERRALNAEVRAYIKKTRALAAYLTALARAAKALAALERFTRRAQAVPDVARGVTVHSVAAPGRVPAAFPRPCRSAGPRDILPGRAVCAGWYRPAKLGP
jgi:hypothetical protein